MKKIIFVFWIMAITFMLTGCDSNSKNVVHDINGKEKTNFNLNEVAVFKNIHYVVTNVKYSNGSDWDKPASGKQFVIVTIKIENKSDSKVTYNTLDWKMINSDGQIDSDAFTTINNDTNLGSGNLASGGTKVGTIVFEEPKNATLLKLQFYPDLLFDEKCTFEVNIK